MPADTYGSLPKQLDHAASMVINSYKANSQKRCKPYLELNLVHDARPPEIVTRRLMNLVMQLESVYASVDEKVNY